MTPSDRPTDAELLVIAKAASELGWSLDQYGSVITPDGRTAELNGFATVCGYGEGQLASKARAKLIVRMVAAFPSLLERLQAAEQNAANRLADVEALEESAREDAAALATSEASRLSVEGDNGRLREALVELHAQTLAIMKRKGVKVAPVGSPYRELYDRVEALLSLPVGAGGQDHTVSQDPGPHPCGEQPGADVAATAALAPDTQHKGASQ